MSTCILESSASFNHAIKMLLLLLVAHISAFSQYYGRDEWMLSLQAETKGLLSGTSGSLLGVL